MWSPPACVCELWSPPACRAYTECNSCTVPCNVSPRLIIVCVCRCARSVQTNLFQWLTSVLLPSVTLTRQAVLVWSCPQFLFYPWNAFPLMRFSSICRAFSCVFLPLKSPLPPSQKPIASLLKSHCIPFKSLLPAFQKPIAPLSKARCPPPP